MRVAKVLGFPTAHALARAAVNPGTYTLFDGFAHLASGLACGLAGLAAGMAIGIVGDAGVRWVGGGNGEASKQAGPRLGWSGGCCWACPALGSSSNAPGAWQRHVTHPPVLAFHASAARPHTRQPNERFSFVGRASLPPHTSTTLLPLRPPSRPQSQRAAAKAVRGHDPHPHFRRGAGAVRPHW